ncbi:MAG: hypothetical protein V1774_05155 [Candidatus Eisenbacteria bacterium]
MTEADHILLQRVAGALGLRFGATVARGIETLSWEQRLADIVEISQDAEAREEAATLLKALRELSVDVRFFLRDYDANRSGAALQAKAHEAERTAQEERKAREESEQQAASAARRAARMKRSGK